MSVLVYSLISKTNPFRKILTKNAKKDKEEDNQKMEAEEVIKRAETPKMVKTVIQVSRKHR